MIETIISIILAPFAVIAAGFVICLAIGIVKGIVKAFKKP